jgi:hypothetical protein
MASQPQDLTEKTKPRDAEEREIFFAYYKMLLNVYNYPLSAYSGPGTNNGIAVSNPIRSRDIQPIYCDELCGLRYGIGSILCPKNQPED